MDLLSTPSVRSPSLSWASISRDASPECTLSTFEDKEVAVRPYKRRLGSTLIRSPDISKAAASSSEMSTTETTGSSSTASARKRHVRQMKIKIKPTTFICESPGCGKKFSRAYNLTSHMKTHSTERPFTCGSCPLAFARRHDRERHMRLHTGEKPYSCKSCGAGFMRNDALHRHLKICGQSTAAIMALLHPQAERH
ncbi:hypothetical protein BGZ46_002525 [Entomortierella lignicola]|nr:hypothetical protein BGZ46_002525 [Entomortierella lignicola]